MALRVAMTAASIRRQHLDDAVVAAASTQSRTLAELARDIPACKKWDALDGNTVGLFRLSLSLPCRDHADCHQWHRRAMQKLIAFSGHSDDFAVWLGCIGWMKTHDNLAGFRYFRPTFVRAPAEPEHRVQGATRSSNRAGDFGWPARALYFESLVLRRWSKTQIARHWRNELHAWTTGMKPSQANRVFNVYREWERKPRSRREIPNANIEAVVARVHLALKTVSSIRREGWSA